MKKNNLIALLAIVVIVFSSCSNEEISTLEDNQTSLLKTYKVKRDATGAYSVDFDVSNNTKVERFINADNNSEYLLSSSNVETKEDFSQDLEINDSNWEGLAPPDIFPLVFPKTYDLPEGQITEYYYQKLKEQQEKKKKQDQGKEWKE